MELNYDWRWDLLFQYIVRIDEKTGAVIPGLILKGFWTTIKLSIYSIAIAFAIAIVLGPIRSGNGAAAKLTGLFYVHPVRNIPPLVFIFIFYYFFATPFNLSAFASAAIAMGLYEGAYITEIVKAGINSVGKGQWEASKALGLSRQQMLRLVILPQAVRYILPPLAGQFISTIKDSAIVSVISVQELTFQGFEVMVSTYLTFEIWIVITALYFILTFSCSIFFEKLFKHLRRDRSL